jgi:hypothetical protein
MLSRRSFIASSITIAFSLNTLEEVLAKKSQIVRSATGPHCIVRQEWPPAISPEFLSIINKGNCLVADQSGRIAIVDLKQADSPNIIGEVSGVGKRIFDLVAVDNKAYAITLSDSHNDSQFMLAALSTNSAHDPSVISQAPIPHFSEPTCLVVRKDIVCIGGVGLNGENQVLIFSCSLKKKNMELTLLSTLSFKYPIAKLDLQDKQLVVAQNNFPTPVDVINLHNPHLPETISSATYDGGYVALIRKKESLLIITDANKKFHCYNAVIKHSLSSANTIELTDITEVFDIAAQKEQCLLLAAKDGKQVIIPILFDKSKQIYANDPILLQAGKHGATSKAKIVTASKQVYVASDSGTVQILNIDKNSWQYLYSYTIPRLPAASIAMANNKVILAGTDLKLYDFRNLNQAILLSEVEVTSTIRAIIALDNCILCLERERLTLRSLEKLSEIRSSITITGSILSYDPVLRKAYVIDNRENNAKLTSIAVSEDKLNIESTQNISMSIRRANAKNGKLLLAGLNDLILYKTDKEFEVIGKRELGNLAIRDLSLDDNYAAVACLTKTGRGFLLIISVENNDLTTLGATDLPQDAAAIALNKSLAVIVGKNQDGKDYASIVNLDNVSQPRTITSLPVLEAASAVTIKDKFAAVAGRGLEILSLT